MMLYNNTTNVAVSNTCTPVCDNASVEILPVYSYWRICVDVISSNVDLYYS
jgi:hypothetical protein